MPAKTRKPVTIGAAEYVGTFPHNTLSWYAARAELIGGSDIAAILGLSPYKSAFTLWHEKAGLITPAEPDERQRRKLAYGHHMEPFIAGIFHEGHPELSIQETGTWRNAGRRWQGCNPDRLLALADSPADTITPHALLEIKTFPSLADWEDGLPPHIHAQVCWQLDTFGFRRGWVAGYANMSGDYVEHEVDVDPFRADAVRAKALAFADSIADGLPPEIDGSEGTYQTLRRLNPSLDRGSEAEITPDIAEQYLEATKYAKWAESDLNKWKGHLLAHMGTAQYAVYDGKKIASRVAVKDSVPYLKEA